MSRHAGRRGRPARLAAVTPPAEAAAAPAEVPAGADTLRRAFAAAGAAGVLLARTPNPHDELARRLVQPLTPEAEARIATATAEMHDVVAALNTAAARLERLRAQRPQLPPSRNLPQDIPQWTPGDGCNLPPECGGEFFETDPVAHFWEELSLAGVHEDLAELAANLARDLEAADPHNAVTRAGELLSPLPLPMLDAFRARLAELAAPRGRGGERGRRRLPAARKE